MQQLYNDLEIYGLNLPRWNVKGKLYAYFYGGSQRNISLPCHSAAISRRHKAVAGLQKLHR